ncbi:MAG: hypothetical protein LBM66_02605 [Bifidobacteriaceae bacterium]|jgi:hypothetical protein|nr:hypothetical protein [Bifidobacteriaceae bacterium]
MAEPADDLTTPVAKKPIPDLVDRIFDPVPDLLDPGAFLLRVIQKIPKVKDAISGVTHNFAGNWQAVAQAEDALRKLSSFMDSTATELRVASNTAFAEWSGSAADAAQDYFTTLYHAIQDASDPITAVASDYDQVCIGMWENAQAVKDLMSTLLDLMLAFGASLLVTGTNFWNPAGWISAGAAGAMVIKIISTVSDILDIFGAAATLAETFIGDIASALGTYGGMENIKLPGSALSLPQI